MQLHHVQLSMHRGEEDAARNFYQEGLGLEEVPKPPALAPRGGCWFRSPAGSGDRVEIHLGVEDGFTASAKAHPAFVLNSRAELDAMAERIQRLNMEVSWKEEFTFEGYSRFHAKDPFGNRLEFLAVAER
ncbi:glyoxalase [Glutamicibacter uratoxydans]|uniref:Glyoxalase n=1 Tax=Glutamicibacter uratoxydans TaxID=43667 RepID=A0A4Y4DIJ4_GLUUR|nr:VOC family protein [Glutamicibacter uratoxydans]GED04776.1 glyoxalase [Glutamicibacter uratoxydans]